MRATDELLYLENKRSRCGSTHEIAHLKAHGYWNNLKMHVIVTDWAKLTDDGAYWWNFVFENTWLLKFSLFTDVEPANGLLYLERDSISVIDVEPTNGIFY